MEIELEDAIEHLTAKNRMKIQDIWKKLGLDRSSFQSWRRSIIPTRRAELCEEIIKAFPDEFTEDKIEKIKQ